MIKIRFEKQIAAFASMILCRGSFLSMRVRHGSHFGRIANAKIPNQREKMTRQKALVGNNGIVDRLQNCCLRFGVRFVLLA